MSISNYREGQMLASLPEKPWVKLHTGDPGEEGTANAAGETKRKQVTLGAAASGTRKSTTAAEWPEVSTGETITHVSLWSAESGGNCEWIIPLEASKAVSAGDAFLLKAEELSVSLD